MGDDQALRERIEKGFKELAESLEEILVRLNEGAVFFENLRLRVSWLEKAVYGAAGIAVTAVVLVVREIVVRAL